MIHDRPGRATTHRTLPILALLSAAWCIGATPVAAQTALHLITPNPVPPHQALPASHAGAVAATAPATAIAPRGLQHLQMVLRGVRLVGAHAIPPARLAALWRPMLGRMITGADIARLGRQIAKLYDNAGYALINVQVPPQNFANGIVALVVQEGYVGNVVIEGDTKNADLSLLKRYAAHIITDRPLRRRTLERYILLMNDIPGLKVGSRFEPFPGHPGVARLRLTILRHGFQAGADFNNQGNGTLGTSQITLNAVGNSLLHEGDSTQLVFGFPAGFNRYQYYGLSHTEPLGSDGTTLTFGYGRLVTRPQSLSSGGTADTFTLRLSYPVIRAVRETLVVNADLNALNSNAAYLGQSLSDERTRSVRIGALYGRADSWKGTTILSGTFSEGLNVLGARRGSLAFGGPDYTKFYGMIARAQQLPLHLVLRARLLGQYATDHLPSTEQFLFGGPEIGKAYDYAFLAGDRGLAGYVELAHPWPHILTPTLLAGSEVFAYADWGEADTINTPYQYRSTHAASAGGGLRIRLANKFTLELGAAWAIDESPMLAHQDSPRLVFNLGGHF